MPHVWLRQNDQPAILLVFLCSLLAAVPPDAPTNVTAVPIRTASTGTRIALDLLLHLVACLLDSNC